MYPVGHYQILEHYFHRNRHHIKIVPSVGGADVSEEFLELGGLFRKMEKRLNCTLENGSRCPLKLRQQNSVKVVSGKLLIGD
jgi:hypothetical protein